MDDEVEKAFLDELAAVDRLRITYSSSYPNTPLSRDDPEVRRMLEGMAMFTARTRVASARALHNNILRIFRQHLSYLLGPAPAMSMLRAKPTSRFVDAATLPGGSEVLFVAPGEKGANDHVFRFRTRRDLRLLPLELASITPLRTADRGFRFVLQFRWTTRHAMMMNVGELNLHINHLDDLASSVLIAHALEKNIISSCVIFGQTVREDTEGAPCRISFGAPPRSREDLQRGGHPLRDVRNALRFPREHLFMNIHGINLPKAVEGFAVCLDVGPEYPLDLRPMVDSFELFAVPMINERLDMAIPIEHDGTKERHLVLHPDVAGKFVPADILGVYRMTDKGMDPIEPAVITTRPGRSNDPTTTRPTYDVTYEGIDHDRMALITLAIAGAFDKPVDIGVEAMWHQPSVDEVNLDDVQVTIANRHLAGIDWSNSGKLIPHAESEIQNDDQELLELLSIKHLRVLEKDHLRCLLRAVGAAEGTPYAKFLSMLQSVSVEKKPAAKSSNGFKYVYNLQYAEMGPTEIPKFEIYCRRLFDLISAWCTEEVVEIVARVAGGRATVRVKENA